MGQKNCDVRISLQMLRVLEAFLDNPAEALSGSDVHKRSGLASGTVVCQPMGDCGPFRSRATAPQALPTDYGRARTGE
jgi:hypothetical protein